MDFGIVNEKVLTIIKMNEQLSRITYNDPNYDQLEDKVYEIQDEVNDKFGDYFEDIMEDVYKELGCDDDVLNFTDYIAKSYTVSGEKNPDGSLKFEEAPNDCIIIRISPKALNGKSINAKIYLKPNPLRIGFAIEKLERIVWNSEQL
ncbi:MAG: hypothetical protein H0V01_11230 [Bacteroidetes bacterium]|nr:hypothetical protein [Bacteroidota bacterium]HET6243338.1 hypothetical protein [Bacteroidia bacterium]